MCEGYLWGKSMKILFWMFSGFDIHTTSEHLLKAVLEQLCDAGHSVHIIQKNLNGNLPIIPGNLKKESVTTDVVPFKNVHVIYYIIKFLYFQ